MTLHVDYSELQVMRLLQKRVIYDYKILQIYTILNELRVASGCLLESSNLSRTIVVQKRGTGKIQTDLTRTYQTIP